MCKALWGNQEGVEKQHIIAVHLPVTICRTSYQCHMCVSLCIPLCAIGLAPAGHRVADTRPGARVHVLDHDEGMLLQRGHCQVTVIRHLLQKAAVTRPDGVANLEDPSRIRTHLESETDRYYLRFQR